jgi:hypothetical protein
VGVTAKRGNILRLLYSEELVPGFVPAVCGTEFR